MFNCIKNKEAHLSGAEGSFELCNKITQIYGMKYSLLTSSATAAMQLIVMAFGISKKRIVSTPYHWPGVLTPLLYDKNSIRITPLNNKLEMMDMSINGDVFLAVDYMGIPHLNQQELADYCKRNEILYITDGSSSFGTTINDVPSGSLSDILILSFGPHKDLYAGEMGAILTSSEDYYMSMLELMHPYMQLSNGLEPNYFCHNFRANPFGIDYLNQNFYRNVSEIKERQIFLKNSYNDLLNNGYVDVANSPSFSFIQSNNIFFKPLKFANLKNLDDVELIPVLNFSFPKYLNGRGKIISNSPNKFESFKIIKL